MNISFFAGDPSSKKDPKLDNLLILLILQRRLSESKFLENCSTAGWKLGYSLLEGDLLAVEAEIDHDGDILLANLEPESVCLFIY